MQKLNYQWTQEDALHYYELLLSTAHETRLTRMISILWGPALSVALMIGFQQGNSLIAWLLAVSFSLIWIFVIAPRFYHHLCKSAAKRKLSANELAWDPIEFEEKAGDYEVNGVKKEPLNYFVMPDFLIVTFTDHTQLVIPERAFEQDEERMRQWLKRLALTVKDKQNSKVQEIKEIAV